jgi:hypothetical protein
MRLQTLQAAEQRSGDATCATADCIELEHLSMTWKSGVRKRSNGKHPQDLLRTRALWIVHGLQRMAAAAAVSLVIMIAQCVATAGLHTCSAPSACLTHTCRFGGGQTGRSTCTSHVVRPAVSKASMRRKLTGRLERSGAGTDGGTDDCSEPDHTCS